MARAKKNSPQGEEVRPYLEGVAQNLVAKLYGPDGPAWGTRLTELEALLLARRAILTEKMRDESRARQAAAQAPQTDAARPCPGCQQPLPCDDTNPRSVQTDAGEAEGCEPKAFCTRCRRAFFPSVPELGP